MLEAEGHSISRQNNLIKQTKGRFEIILSSATGTSIRGSILQGYQ